MKIGKNGSHVFIFVLALSILISWAAAAKTSEPWDAKATARVNLRRSPGPKGVILSIVPQGHKVRIIEKKGLWCKVDVEGEIHGKGWVYAKYLEEFLPKVPQTESASHFEEVLPKAPETGSASYLEETLPEALQTESASETLRLENTSGGQTQVIHPAQSPPKVRTVDNKEYLLISAPPAKASRGNIMEKRLIRDEFRSGKDNSIADSKREVPADGEAAHFFPSQIPPEVRTEDQKTKPPNGFLSGKVSITGAKEQPSVRNELQHVNNKSNPLSTAAPALPDEPVYLLPTESPYSGGKHALRTVKEISSGAAERRNAAIDQKGLLAGEMKHTGAIQETPFAVREKAVTDVHDMAADQRKKPLFRSELMRPAKRVLKLLSIVLSCLVLLLLYRENKTATKRYIEQTDHPPAM